MYTTDNKLHSPSELPGNCHFNSSFHRRNKNNLNCSKEKNVGNLLFLGGGGSGVRGVADSLSGQGGNLDSNLGGAQVGILVIGVVNGLLLDNGGGVLDAFFLLFLDHALGGLSGRLLGPLWSRASLGGRGGGGARGGGAVHVLVELALGAAVQGCSRGRLEASPLSHLFVVGLYV